METLLTHNMVVYPCAWSPLVLGHLDAQSEKPFIFGRYKLGYITSHLTLTDEIRLAAEGWAWRM